MPPPPRTTGPARDRIVDAADHLMRTIGLARVTTREIAREAGCSEAALYKHFSGKEDLFVAVLAERLPPLAPLLARLATDDSAGTTDVAAQLTEVAREAARFYEASVPVAASLFAEPALLARHRDAMAEIGAGPHRPVEALAAWLQGQRDRGALRADADPDAAARLLLGACLQRAFLVHVAPDPVVQPPVDEFAAATARVVLHGIT